MTTCRRCGRTLKTVRHTDAAGAPLGPTCFRRERAEQAYSPQQVEKAHELLELGAIARTPIRTDLGHRVFVLIPSSGQGHYFATRVACDCPAGLKGRRCYHRLAVALAA